MSEGEKTASVKPVGWFNPWNDYHGYQQVAPEFEGKRGTLPLYDKKALTSLTTQLEAALKERNEALARADKAEEALSEIRDMRTDLPARGDYERGFNNARFRCKQIAEAALKTGAPSHD